LAYLTLGLPTAAGNLNPLFGSRWCAVLASVKFVLRLTILLPKGWSNVCTATQSRANGAWFTCYLLADSASRSPRNSFRRERGHWLFQRRVSVRGSLASSWRFFVENADSPSVDPSTFVAAHADVMRKLRPEHVRVTSYRPRSAVTARLNNKPMKETNMY